MTMQPLTNTSVITSKLAKMVLITKENTDDYPEEAFENLADNEEGKYQWK